MGAPVIIYLLFTTGVAIVPSAVMKQVPIEGFRLTRTLNLVSRVQKYFSPVALRFREFAKSYGIEHLEPLAAHAERHSGARAHRPEKTPGERKR